MRTSVPLVVALAVAVAAPALASARDSVWVLTFDHDFYNWADPHEATFEFPPLTHEFSQVLLHYTIECPEAPGDCDPWDRLGWLRILHEEPDQSVTPYEIARIVTPYDITGTGRPGSCTWVLDVTDYRFLLHDQVTLRNYIETWIGGTRGWIVTVEFEFVPGSSPAEAYRIVNLWTLDRLVFGDPANPVEDHLQPVTVDVEPDAVSATVRAITTGHGQGNTLNAAEFSNLWHAVSVEGSVTSHQLWRSDCAQNLCSPQGGTWAYNRAGWCPGDAVTPWDVDATPWLVPGSTLVLDYDIQPYENLCRPTNPSCVSGVTCPDCNYNYNGHTEPHYTLVGQLILRRFNPELFADGFESGDTAAWGVVASNRHR